jgi:hypothetical protein
MDSHYEKLLERVAAVTPTASKLTRGDLYDLVRVVEVLAIERPNPDQLWTVHRIGSYLGIDALTVERLFKAPGSPQPLEGDRGVKVWRAKDVYRWLDQHGKANLKMVAA